MHVGGWLLNVRSIVFSIVACVRIDTHMFDFVCVARLHFLIGFVPDQLCSLNISAQKQNAEVKNNCGNVNMQSMNEEQLHCTSVF